MFRCLGLLLLTGSVFAVPAPVHRDYRLLECKWLCVRVERGTWSADFVPAANREKFIAVCAAGKISLPRLGASSAQEGTFRLDPSQEPKSIDLVLTKGPYEGMVLEGIYQVSENTLQLCLPLSPLKGDRPKQFTTENSTGPHFLWIFKKERW